MKKYTNRLGIIEDNLVEEVEVVKGSLPELLFCIKISSILSWI